MRLDAAPSNASMAQPAPKEEHSEGEDVISTAVLPKFLYVSSVIRESATSQEMEDHWVTHFPFRSCCPVCIKAGGREDSHKDAGQD